MLNIKDIKFENCFCFSILKQNGTKYCKTKQREREKTALGDITNLGITTQLSQFVLAKR